MKQIFIFFVIVGILLVVTNPSKEDFMGWVSEEIQDRSDSEVEAFLGGFIAKPLIELATERKDYILFSVYTVKAPDEKRLILGIAKQFIELP